LLLLTHCFPLKLVYLKTALLVERLLLVSPASLRTSGR
jgi:hypothetical protein